MTDHRPRPVDVFHDECMARAEAERPPAPAGQAPATDRAALLAAAVAELEALRVKTDVNVAEYPRYDARQRSALDDGIRLLRRMAVEAQQPSPPSEDCTCIPVTRQGGVQRYCQPGDTVDMISGWEIGGDCPHHRDAVQAQQPARHIPCPDAFWRPRRHAPHNWQQAPDTQPVHCPGVPDTQQQTEARPCGPVPYECDAETGDPCADHEREQSHADNDHSLCRSADCEVLRQS